jgi:hypothetical protein
MIVDVDHVRTFELPDPFGDRVELIEALPLDVPRRQGQSTEENHDGSAGTQ